MLHALRMLLILMGAIALTFMIFEARFIFYPEREHVQTPEAQGLPFEDVKLETKDGVTLHAWFIGHERPRATMLFLHGNAGNISHRVEKAAMLHRLGLQLFLFDYRGYGHSKGRPSEVGTYRDAEAAWSVLSTRRDVDPARLVCFGESLGGAVAVELAIHRPCAALILESTFTSVPSLAAELFPALPLRWLLSTRYDSLARISQVRAPVLFIHGTQDELVPFSHAKRLLAAANEPKRLYAVEGAGHNDPFLVGGDAWTSHIDSFLSQAL